MEGGKYCVNLCLRNLEDVEELLELAKIKSNDLLPERQILYFSEAAHDYKLLELNSEIMESFKEKQTVIFRGGEGKKAVLCTDSKTFEVLEAETSNSSLLIPNLNASLSDGCASTDADEPYLMERAIEGVLFSYYVLRKINRRIEYELESVLKSCLYSGPENECVLDEGIPVQRLYLMSDLLNICQSSQKQMEKALESISACKINGYWRLLKFDYHLRVFTQLLNLVDSNSWPINRIPGTESLEELSQIFPEAVVRHVFSLYTDSTYERDENGEALYSYNEENICRFLGEALLRDGVGNAYDLERFVEAWRSSVPEGLNTDLKYLTGLAIIVESGATKSARIKLCSESELPIHIPDRIDHLLTMKKKWTIDELIPYIKPLLPEKMNVKIAIIKYMHESVEDGRKFYSCKH